MNSVKIEIQNLIWCEHFRPYQRVHEISKVHTCTY